MVGVFFVKLLLLLCGEYFYVWLSENVEMLLLFELLLHLLLFDVLLLFNLLLFFGVKMDGRRRNKVGKGWKRVGVGLPKNFVNAWKCCVLVVCCCCEAVVELVEVLLLLQLKLLLLLERV